MRHTAKHIWRIPALVLALALGGPVVSAAEVGIEVVFSTEEAAIIRGYYYDHSVQPRHPGKKRKSLPPGIAKNLERGKPLPPGIAKQVLPGELRRELPPPHEGYERVIVDGRVLLIEIATQVIHDVLTDIVLG